MNRRPSTMSQTLTHCLLVAGIASIGLILPAGAADRPQPTFLESGDNDLIRFQKGDVPIIPGIGKPLKEVKKRAEPATQPVSEGRARLITAPEPAAEMESDADEEIVAEAVAQEVTAPTPKPALTDQLFSSGVQAYSSSVETSESRDQRSGIVARRAPERLEHSSVPLGGQPQQQGLAAKIVAPAPAAAPLLSQEPLDDEVDARLVTVCLNNPVEASGAKAFDIRREGPPRYLADVGSTACARFEPTRHTVYFWKSNDLGALSLVLSSRLDLNNSDGTQVTMDWLRDR